MYAAMKHAIPKLRAFTLCLWLRPAEGGIGTPLSYAVSEQPNELVLLQGLRTPAELLINDQVLHPPADAILADELIPDAFRFHSDRMSQQRYYSNK